MKKLKRTIILSLLPFLCLLTSNKTSNNIYDEIRNICSFFDINLKEIKNIKDLNILNNPNNGYVSEIISEKGEGYIMLEKRDNHYILMDYSFESISPFKDYNKNLYYINDGIYFVKDNDEFININNFKFEETSIISKKNGDYTDYNYDISPFIYKEYINESYNSFFRGEDYKTINNKEYNNYCANVAGIEMLDYWNLKFNNKLLSLKDDEKDYKGHISIEKSKEYFLIFNDYMSTSNTFGTYPSNAVKGFKKYINEIGFKCDINKKDVSINLDSYMKNDGKIYYTTSVGSDFTGIGWPNYMIKKEKGILTTKRYEGLSNAHSYVGFGYRLFYDLNKNSDFIEFMDAASGWRYYSDDNQFSGHVLSYFGKDRPTSIYEVNVYL